MKTCPVCGEYKSHAEFYPYARHCKACVNAERREKYRDSVVPKYALRDLRYRPAEHLLEALTLKQLSAALGMCKDTLAPMKRDPSACAGTYLEWDDEKVAKVRAWIDKQVA